MKIGIISDTHENMPMIARAVKLFNDQGVDCVLHAGDIISPITCKEFSQLKAPMDAVFGNNDGDKSFLRERLGRVHQKKYECELAGKKVLVIHEPDFLDALIASGGYDLIVYGHTHRIDIRKGRPVVINPGECGGWLTGRCTVCIYDTERNEVRLIDLATSESSSVKV